MSKFFPALDFKLRREQLIKFIQERYPEKKGAVLLFGNFEFDASSFKQESSFHYFTNVNEPGAALLIDLQGKSTLFVPNCGPVRASWVSESIDPISSDPKSLEFEELKYLGEQVKGYEFSPFFFKK